MRWHIPPWRRPGTFLGYDKKRRSRPRKLSICPTNCRPKTSSLYKHAISRWAANGPRPSRSIKHLWRDNPDNLELGLRLAKVQRDAGQATDSLATVQQLRALPLPSSDDPRIDLAEASANNSLGEWKLGQAAAGKAAAKALDQSRRQLLADALSRKARLGWASRTLRRR